VSPLGKEVFDPLDKTHLADWNTLHPGRSWAERVEQPNNKNAEEISAVIVSYLATMAGV